MTRVAPRPVFTADPAAAGWTAGGCRSLLLDRDGVINVNHGYVHTVDRTDWVPGIFELAADARRAGFVLVVVTNQAGIGRGYYTDALFQDYARWMHGEFASRGTPLLATYYCPDHPEAALPAYRVDSGCRKPQPGMLLAAARDWEIDLGASVLVGDQPGDIEAARRAGVGTSFLLAQDGGFEDVRAWLAASRAWARAG